MNIVDRVRDIVAPLLAGTAVELVEVEHLGGVLRITVDRPGGVDLDAIAQVTRTVSRALDDADPLPGRYTLEVSSPGLERPLRTPDQFRRAVGSSVVVKATADIDGDRRLQGVLVAVDDEGVTLRDSEALVERHLRHDQIERARTTFAWGPAPKPGAPRNAPGNQPKKTKTKKKAATR